MKKASNILLKIAHILGLIMGIFLLVCFVPAMCLAFIPQARESLVLEFQNNGVDFGDDPELLATIGMLIILGYSLIFVVMGVLCIVVSAITKKAMQNPSRGGYIACIIVGAMCMDVSVVGGILGLIALNKQKKSEEIEY